MTVYVDGLVGVTTPAVIFTDLAGGQITVKAWPGTTSMNNAVFPDRSGIIAMTTMNGTLILGPNATGGTVELAPANGSTGNTFFYFPLTNGNPGDHLATDGAGNTYWTTGGAAGASPPNMSVQYNSAGSFMGSGNFLFDDTLNKLTIGSGALAQVDVSGGFVAITNPNINSALFIDNTNGGLALYRMVEFLADGVGVADVYYDMGSLQFVFDTHANNWHLGQTGAATVGYLQGSAGQVAAPLGLLVLGMPTSHTGMIRLYNSTNVNSVTIESATNLAPWVFKLPTGAGNPGQQLTTDGSGNTYWAASSTGAGGTNGSVQFNNGGALDGNDLFTYDGNGNASLGKPGFAGTLELWGSTSGSTIIQASPVAGGPNYITLPATNGTLVTSSTALMMNAVLFGGPTGEIAQDVTHFYWDDATNILRLGAPGSGGKLSLMGSTSGSATINCLATAGAVTITIPSFDGYIALTDAQPLTYTAIPWVDTLGRLTADVTNFKWNPTNKALELGSPGNGGRIDFFGNTSGYTTIMPQPAAGNNTIMLPNSNGTLLTSTGALTMGSVLFADAAGAITEDNTHFYWDDAANILRLGDVGGGGQLALRGSTSGTATIDALPVAGAVTITIPSFSGYIALTDNEPLTYQSVPFIDSIGRLTEDNNNFKWNDTNKSLELGSPGNGGRIDFFGNTSGYTTLIPNAAAGNNTVTLPNGTGTLVTSTTALTNGSVLFASPAGEITEDNANFYYNNATNTLRMGSVGGNGKIDMLGNTSGTISIVPSAVAGTNTFTLPAITGYGVVSDLAAMPNTAVPYGNAAGQLTANTNYLKLDLSAGVDFTFNGGAATNAGQPNGFIVNQGTVSITQDDPNQTIYIWNSSTSTSYHGCDAFYTGAAATLRWYFAVQDLTGIPGGDQYQAAWHVDNGYFFIGDTQLRAGRPSLYVANGRLYFRGGAGTVTQIAPA